MAFAGINYVAIVIAAVVAWLAGAAWYMSLGKLWMSRNGQIAECKNRPHSYLPFIYVFVAELIMAWVLAGLLGHLGPVTLRSGIISAAFCWLGFVITAMVVNNSFAMRSWRLTLIDGGYWLLALLLIGAIIGAMGA